MSNYKKVTADEAVAMAEVETYQAGEWVPVERVVVDGTTASVRFVGGGTSVAPTHFFTFRVLVDA